MKTVERSRERMGRMPCGVRWMATSPVSLSIALIFSLSDPVLCARACCCSTSFPGVSLLPSTLHHYFYKPACRSLRVVYVVIGDLIPSRFLPSGASPQRAM